MVKFGRSQKRKHQPSPPVKHHNDQDLVGADDAGPSNPARMDRKIIRPAGVRKQRDRKASLFFPGLAQCAAISAAAPAQPHPASDDARISVLPTHRSVKKQKRDCHPDAADERNPQNVSECQ